MMKVILRVVISLLVAQFVSSFSPIQQYVSVTQRHSSSTYTHPLQKSGQDDAFSKRIDSNAMTLPSSSSSLSMIEPNSIIESSSSIILSSSALDTFLSNDNIKQAFSIATFGPQYLWILMVFLPNTQITKKIMGGYGGIIAFSLVHLFIVIASASQENGTAPLVEFNGVFDPSPEADPQAAMIGMMKYPNFVSEEWSHVLTWDLFVGRWIWLDGLKRGIFTSHSVLLTNLIGPPGFLLHCATCLVTGKGIVGNEVPEDEDKDNEQQ